jgi:hypothetical protein
MLDRIYKLGPAGRARILREAAETAIAHRIGCEQLLNQLTPLAKRNPPSAHEAIQRDGYAVYDGPAAVQPSKGSGDHQ